MKNDQTTLVMAGAREAHPIVSSLQRRGRKVIASLPEPERMFAPLTVPTRQQTFENNDALKRWYRDNQVTVIIDASHAFDSKISNQAAQICAALDLRYVRVMRPPWRPAQYDAWTEYTSIRKAANDVPRKARVFSNTGRGSLPDFADFKGDAVFLRVTQTPSTPPPFAFVRYLVGIPPFSQRDEEDLFRELKVSRLICRNVGGMASASKILAARRLGLPVSMIKRPPPPVGMPLVNSVAEALAWEANP